MFKARAQNKYHLYSSNNNSHNKTRMQNFFSVVFFTLIVMEYRENDLQGLCRRAKAISHITIQRNECINIWNMEAVWITVEPLLSQCPKGSTGRKEIVVCLYAIAFFYPFTFTNSMCQIEPNEIANKWSFFNLKKKWQFYLVQPNECVCLCP